MTRFILALATALLLSGCAIINAKHYLDTDKAINENDVNAVRRLVSKGDAHKNINTPELPLSPFRLALQGGKTDVVRMMIDEKGANINIKGIDYLPTLTPLTFALMFQSNNTELIKLLIDKGADLNFKGEAPTLFYTRNNAELTRLFIEKGADVNAESSNGSRPLHDSSVEVSKLLIEKGAQVNAVNKDGRTALMWAAFVGNRDKVKFLISNGADISLRDKDGKTAADLTKVEHPKTVLAKNSAGKLVATAPEEKIYTEIYNALAAPKIVPELKALISKNDMHGLGAYLDANPDAIDFLEDTNLRLRFRGPPNLRIIDIESLSKNGTKDSLIIAKINSTALPYKDFTADEMIALKKMFISDDVVAAMIAATTEYDKEQKRQAEQKRAAAAQQAAAQQQIKQQQIQVAQAPASESNTPAECVKLIAALKACDQAGGFLAMGCKSVAKSKFDCPTVAQYMR